MNTNMNLNNSNPSFGRIHCVSGGEQFLKRTCNKIQKTKLSELVASQKQNAIDIILAQNTEKRLCGWVAFTEKTNKNYHRKDYTQRLFESPIKFVERLCKKADKLKTKFEGDINENPNFSQFELKL